MAAYFAECCDEPPDLIAEVSGKVKNLDIMSIMRAK